MFEHKVLMHLIIFQWCKAVITLFCRLGFQPICFTCFENLNNCEGITSQFQAIYLTNNIVVNYDLFINSNIRLIIEGHMITFFSCEQDPNIPPFHVTSNNFYPIRQSLNITATAIIKLKKIKSHVFQECLEIYCSGISNNQFRCITTAIKTFEFNFDLIVTAKCLQNITSAYLRTVNVLEHFNIFFLNAHNLIYLNIFLSNGKQLHCRAFDTLTNLRYLNIRFINTNCTFHHECLFYFNPKLIKVVINGQWYLRTCKAINTVSLYNEEHVHIKNPITIHLILFVIYIFVIMVVTIIIFQWILKNYRYYTDDIFQTSDYVGENKRNEEYFV